MSRCSLSRPKFGVSVSTVSNKFRCSTVLDLSEISFDRVRPKKLCSMELDPRKIRFSRARPKQEGAQPCSTQIRCVSTLSAATIVFILQPKAYVFRPFRVSTFSSKTWYVSTASTKFTISIKFAKRCKAMQSDLCKDCKYFAIYAKRCCK